MKLIKLLPVCSLFLLGCTQSDSMELSDFSTDGCSLFIDGTFEKPDLWQECCHKHDIAYWQGGTQEQRMEADLAFKACVEKKTGDSTLAKLMFDAVRAGGEPYFPTWYRWGYGWSIGRGYKQLTTEEQAKVEEKLFKYQNSK